MADTVDSQVLLNGPKDYIIKLIGISDGTGESAVVKVDRSTLTNSNGIEPVRLIVKEIQWSIGGYASIRLYWDHTTDDELAMLATGNGYTDFGGQPAVDPNSSGGTGDILLTSNGAISGATYTVTLHCIKG